MDLKNSNGSIDKGVEEEEELLEKMEFPQWAIANSHFLEFHNRLAPDIDFSCISMLAASIFIYLMFLLIVITARRRKVPTFFIGSIIIFTGSVLVFSYVDPFWYTGSVVINSTYNLHQPDNFAIGEVKIKFGLRTFNISYASLDHINDDFSFSYNERFKFDSSHPRQNLEDIFTSSLQNGLPNPIICILDYLSFSPNREGLSWSNAGCAVADALIFVCFCFVVGIILLILTPKYGLYFIAIDGISLLGVVLLYFLKVPRDPIIIIEGTHLSFGFGRIFYAALIAGSLNILLISVILICICSKKVDHVSTFFELNFDTPWDDQVLVQQSAEAKENNHIHRQYHRRVSVRKIRRSVRRLQDSFNSKISIRFRNHLSETRVRDPQFDQIETEC